MEFSYNNTLYNRSSDLNYSKTFTEDTALVVYASIIFTIEIPLICAAIYVVFCLTKSGQGAPVFVINLLITDLIQIVSFLLYAFNFVITWGVLIIAYFTGMYFMTCVAVERYLLIAHPVWYRSHHPVKWLVCTSLIGWILPFIVILLDLFFTRYLWSIVPFIYYIVIILCFAGAYRALSHSQSVTSIKRRLVLASLFFVLLNYTFTILPIFIILLLDNIFKSSFFHLFIKYAVIFNTLNPIADCVLYVFVRNDVGNTVRTPRCCPRRRIQSETQLTNLTDTQSRNV